MNIHECKKRVSGRLWEGALRDDTKDGCGMFRLTTCTKQEIQKKVDLREIL